MIKVARCKWHPEEKYAHNLRDGKRCGEYGDSVIVEIEGVKCQECGVEYEEAWLAGFCIYLHQSKYNADLAKEEGSR